MFDQAKSWPFQEARKLLAHVEQKGKKHGDVVTFETGYGPSGAPHIGTFAEVVRTLWVMKAFNALTHNAYQTRLIMFSDDYDAMRKVPDGMPEWMNEHLGKPLTHVPSPYPFEEIQEASFGQANNELLARFVNEILKEYDGSELKNVPTGARYCMASSTEYYAAGGFNDMLDRVWDNYQAIMDVMLPTLGEDRRATYSPFMPVTPHEWGPTQVLQVPVQLTGNREIRFMPPMYEDSLTNVTSSIHNGLTKLQWKADWAMRWVYFDVDYEMSGKDLTDSVRESSKICRILGGTPPIGMTYELFLAKDGSKISKSKGNGFSIEQWLRYGSKESLMNFLFQNPKQARPIFAELVPLQEDAALKQKAMPELGPNDAGWFWRAEPVAWRSVQDVNFSLLLNLAIVSQSKTAEALLTYLEESRGLVQSEKVVLRKMAERVINYAMDQGLYDRARREPTEAELAAFCELAGRFEMMVPDLDAEAFQFQVYDVGKQHGFEPLRDWFKALYECHLGSSDGPRFGMFVKCYGVQNTIALLRSHGVECG